MLQFMGSKRVGLDLATQQQKQWDSLCGHDWEDPYGLTGVGSGRHALDHRSRN